MPEVAVIGYACRFPGGIDSIDALWTALLSKLNTAGPIPDDRWSAERYYSSDDKAKGKAYIERGNFLTQDIRQFDASFFDIPPRVAENLDPQQRLLLEVVWEAFENAGLDLTAHAGHKVGVYVGGFMLDHMITQTALPNRTLINQNTAAGMMMTMLSNRISHAFDLRGPSLSIDTACSSSLVAFNYACRDIWNGTTRMAVVGGVNVMTRPEYPLGMCKGQFLSRDGQCKSFDARGDGYGRGEGAGVVLLKALDQALADGDTILATVAGTGTNSDGRTPGISMPSEEAQRALIEEVCAEFAIAPQQVRYVECHGTGTAAGDPIEARSIGKVYGAGRSGDERVVIGSIKSNIGHLEAAAGVAGVIKAVLSLRHRLATPLANLQTPHAEIAFDAMGIRLADEAIGLGAADEPVLAAVNSFGYGGTNAHAILRAAEPANAAKADPAGTTEGSTALPWGHVLPLSTRSPGALKALAARMAASVADERLPLADIVYTAARRRAHLSHRAVVLGDSRDALRSGLLALADGEASAAVCTGVQPYGGRRLPVFVFTGMGPQWWAMGRELYAADPVYRRTLDQADAVFQRVADFSILAEMLSDEAGSRIALTQYAQPANFMLQIGLAAMLRAAGVSPGAVVGHSVGEVSAAFEAGVLCLEDALRVSFHRSRLQARTAGTGGMLAVGLSEEAVAPWLEDLGGQVDVAAVNGPATLTLAGDSAALALLAERLTAAEVFNRALTVEVAYHSHLMDPILDDLAQALDGIAPRTPVVPLYSTVTGQRVDGPSWDAGYWPQNVRQPVAFMRAVRKLIDDGHTTFIEIGPHPVLASALRDCAKSAGKEIRQVETLRRNEPGERQRVLRAVAQVHAHGCDIDWGRLCAPGRQVMLPNYPWQRERQWLESEQGALERIAPVSLPLLGTRAVPASLFWRNDLDHQPLRYLREHVVSGVPLMPAAGHIEALLELGHQLHPNTGAITLRKLQIDAPLLLSIDRSVDFVTHFDRATRLATIRSGEAGTLGEGQSHVRAELSALASEDVQRVDLDALRERLPRTSGIDDFYKGLARIGLSYGPSFQTIRELRTDAVAGEVLARIALADSEPGDLARYRAHPTLLDACFQALIGMLDTSGTTYLPTLFAEIRLSHPLPATFWCHGARTAQTARHIDNDLTLFDDDGRVLAVVRGMRAVAVPARGGRVDQYGDPVKRLVLAYHWSIGNVPPEPRRLGQWLIVEGGAGRLGAPLAQSLAALGAARPAHARVGGEHDGGEAGTHSIRPGQSADVTALLTAVGSLDGIVFLHGLDATIDSQDPTAVQAIAVLADFARALAALPEERRPRAYAITQGAFQVEADDRPVHPGQTAINGFVRVAFNELAGLRFSTIDLPSDGLRDHLDMLGRELVGDAAEDEVALRGQARFFSELTETPVVDTPRLSVEPLTHARRVWVRPTPKDEAIDANLKFVEAPRQPIGADGLLLRVDALGLPISTLADPSADTLDLRLVEVVGTVVERGDLVGDLAVGTRVYGYAPADIASHLGGPRSAFHVVEVEADLRAEDLIGTIGLHGRAERVAELAALEDGAHALVMADPIGLAVAAALARRGARISLLGDPRDAANLGHPCFPATASGVEQALAAAGGVEFEVIAAPAAAWAERFGTRCLRPGGDLIDTALTSEALALPVEASTLIRCDATVLAQRPAKFAQALNRAIELLRQGLITPEQNLPVAANELAWKRVDIPKAQVPVVLRFENDAAEVPIHLEDRAAFKPDATYLVTGGFGGFGQKTALWLADHGARHLALVGRTGADTPERRNFVSALEARGVAVIAAACDTADRVRMDALIDTIQSSGFPLRGVFHSAAVIIDQSITEMDNETLRAVMRSKAESAWVLHQITQGMPLDHFVLYSSVASQVGNSRQASYVAANGFLDGLAWHRRALGLPGMSVNWGAIADVGVVTRDAALEQFLRYIGLRGIGSQEALEVLGKAMLRDITQFCITLVSKWSDWARYETLGSKSPRFANLLASSDDAADDAAKQQVRAALAELAPEERFEALASLICEVVAGELQSVASAIGIDRPVNELGVDSLMATEIQLLLESQLGIAVSVIELLGETSIRTIAERALRDMNLADAELATA